MPRSTVKGKALRANPSTRSLKGVLASKKGKGMSFADIREAATKAARSLVRPGFSKIQRRRVEIE